MTPHIKDGVIFLTYVQAGELRTVQLSNVTWEFDVETRQSAITGLTSHRLPMSSPEAVDPGDFPEKPEAFGSPNQYDNQP